MIWVFSPGNLKGIELLTIAAAAGGSGVVDLNETSPGQWGLLRQNLTALNNIYPKESSLGFRVSAEHFESLIALQEFPAHKSIFFVLPGISAFSDLQIVKKYPQYKFYPEFYSCDELRTLEDYCAGEALPVAGFVAVSAEASGRVGSKSAFLLLQELRGMTDAPIMLRGGVGIHTAGIQPLAGLAGFVLDEQVLLFPGSPLGRLQQEMIARLEGREFELAGEEDGPQYRVLAQPWAAADQQMLQQYHQLVAGPSNTGQYDQFFAHAKDITCWGAPASCSWPVGQMVGMAAVYQKKYKTLQRFMSALHEAINSAIPAAAGENLLSAGNKLSQEHLTEYPVVQGPMTRVSDSPEFALEVAKAGGLPFVALALLKGGQLEGLLAKTSELLNGRTWGAGILGFVPPALRQEQIAAVLKVKPPFAIIAGGRPDQAMELEQAGIKTYLHVPVPALLRSFIKQGSRRFIFEGRECGGHVGPFQSFPLWEQMITTILEELPAKEHADCSVLFAGGISDGYSSAMVGALAARLASNGVKVGVLMGTAYLACEETVATGAITPVFQDMILNSSQTTLLVSGPGHANRCVASPFSDEFKLKRRELLQQGRPQEEISETLDALLLGRLRLATKGIVRKNAGEYSDVTADEIVQEGMFMAGDAANLLQVKQTIRQLHESVTTDAMHLLESAGAAAHQNAKKSQQPTNIAIVGISLIVPGATSAEQFWDTVIHKKNHIGEIPKDRWDWRLLFDEDPKAKDKIYSKWGGFIDDLIFDPLKYGIPPKSVPNIATTQLIALENVSWALEDAGMTPETIDRENTSVIFATADSGGFMGNSLVLRSSMPYFSQEGVADTNARTPEWTEETFPGVLGNVVPGRIANRLDFGGRNYAVDAACASSLVAVDLGVRELTTGRSNLAIVGGIDVGQTPFGYLAFSKTGALSATGESLPFDKKANGIVISEGSAVLVLKRQEDAERDGDKIYAVIKGVAGSSDGRAMGLTAPRSAGQQLSVVRAYDEAGFEARTIGLYEAHGTGTTVGDSEELETICRTLKENGTRPHSVALGSVKSLIGHTKTAAGMVGLAKTALSLYYKVLPPQANLKEPLEKASREDSPVFFHEHTVPWLKPSLVPRRAGVSAFGFGGTNFHAVLEEHKGSADSGISGAEHWPEELFVFGAATKAMLLSELHKVAGQLSAALNVTLRDISWNIVRKYAAKNNACRLSFTAKDINELSEKLTMAITCLEQEGDSVVPKGIAYKCAAVSERPKVAFVFSGQGSQYVHMGREVALYFAEFRQNLELGNRVLADHFPAAITDYLYPGNPFTQSMEAANEAALNNTHVAQPAIGLVSTSYFDVLSRIGLTADFMAGHSFGELTALHAAGMYSRTDYVQLAAFRGRVMAQAGNGIGSMAAVLAPAADVQQYLDTAKSDVIIANYNSPGQVVISGAADALQQAIEALTTRGIKCIKLPVSAAFHSPMMADASVPLKNEIADMVVSAPTVPVYSNGTGAAFSTDVATIKEAMGNHLLQPVRFADQITAMYAAGARIFIEVGPGRVLTGLISKILEHEAHVALPVDGPGSGVGNLLSVSGKLWVEGASIDLLELFRDRRVESFDITTLADTHGVPQPKPTNWIINGQYAKPMNPAFEKNLPQPILTSEKQIKRTETMNKEQSINSTAAAQEPQQVVSGQPAAGAYLDPATAAYFAYQETMRQFLRTQEQVMNMFLGGDVSQAPAAMPGTTAMGSMLSMPVYSAPVMMQQPQAHGMHHAAAPVVQHQPAPAAAPQVAAPTVPQVTPVAASPAKGIAKQLPDSEEAIFKILVENISERTGYPEDMIGIELDLEAELGVDSIKRMEIFGKFLAHLPAGKETALAAHADRFVRIKKLKDLVAALAAETGVSVTNAKAVQQA